MVGKIGAAAAVSLFALTAGAVRAEGREDDRKAIAAGETAWGEAFVKADPKLAAPLIADDFQGVAPDGDLYDRAGALADIAAGPAQSADDTRLDSIRFFGDAAVATGHERSTGPAPAFAPQWLVFTDTWIRRDGRWRIVAAQDSDLGAPSPAASAADVADIRSLRAASNRAIAAHDAAAAVQAFAEDAVFVFSNGGSAVGQAAMRATFARDFADRAFVAYVRAPARIVVSEAGSRAAEHGTWTAIWREPAGETRYGGDYAAHWARTPEGWRVRGELYVKLRCAGPRCTP